MNTEDQIKFHLEMYKMGNTTYEEMSRRLTRGLHVEPIDLFMNEGGEYVLIYLAEDFVERFVAV